MTDGTVTDAWTGLTAVTDVELGPDDLYAAEMSIDTSISALPQSTSAASCGRPVRILRARVTTCTCW